MREIVPNIWTWSIFNEEKKLNFNGWYIRGRDEAVVIDPPTPKDSILKEIHQKGRPLAVLLTNKHHTRAAEVFRRTFDSPVWVNANDLKLMEIPVDRPFSSGDPLPCGLKAVTLKNQKTPGETAFLFGNVLIVGDALIGKPTGSLCMLPAEKFKDVSKAKEGLRILLKEKFDTVLVGDGESILTNGHKVLAAFLTPDSLQA